MEFYSFADQRSFLVNVVLVVNLRYFFNFFLQILLLFGIDIVFCNFMCYRFDSFIQMIDGIALVINDTNKFLHFFVFNLDWLLFEVSIFEAIKKTNMNILKFK